MNKYFDFWVYPFFAPQWRGHCLLPTFNHPQLLFGIFHPPSTICSLPFLIFHPLLSICCPMPTLWHSLSTIHYHWIMPSSLPHHQQCLGFVSYCYHCHMPYCHHTITLCYCTSSSHNAWLNVMSNYLFCHPIYSS